MAGPARVARELRQRTRQHVHGWQGHAEPLTALGQLGDPSEAVVAAVSPGHAAGRTDRQIDPPAGLEQLLRELRARLPGADHQDRARRKIRLLPVVVGVDLDEALRQLGGYRWRLRPVERARGDNDRRRVEWSVGGLEVETTLPAGQPAC